MYWHTLAKIPGRLSASAFRPGPISNIIYHQLATIPTSSIMTLWRIEVQVPSSVVKVKPAGTGRPMDAISGKLAPLPPNLVADDALGSHGFMAGI
jgi:hypothetical protein